MDITREMVEERISECKDGAIEITQAEACKAPRGNQRRHNKALRTPGKILSGPICFYLGLQNARRETRTKNILEEIMAIFQNG